MINLCLVVIATQFSETKKREMERMELERRRSNSTLGSGQDPKGCYDEIIKLIEHLFHQAKRKVSVFLKEQDGIICIRKQFSESLSAVTGNCRTGGGQVRESFAEGAGGVESTGTMLLEEHQPTAVTNTDSSSLRAPRASPEVSDVDVGASPRRPHFAIPVVVESSQELWKNSILRRSQLTMPTVSIVDGTRMNVGSVGGATVGGERGGNADGLVLCHS